MNNEKLFTNEDNNNNNSVNTNNEQPVNQINNNNEELIDNNQPKKEEKKVETNENIIDEEENEKKKKQENLVVASKPDNSLISGEVNDKAKTKTEVINDKLSKISSGSGLNLKAYFVEDNKKEVDDIAKGNLGYTNFTFNGNMKEFYSNVYKHVLESNLINRQLSNKNEREHLPTFEELSKNFEDFMKDIGEELVKRGHLEKYEPFGGLSANEVKEIENSCLLNRPKNEKEAIMKNVTNVKGKNYDELVENSFNKISETIINSYDPSTVKIDDLESSRKFLQNSANLINGYKDLRRSEKIWNTYLPDLSAPKWNKPIYRHPISNAFKAIGKGFSIAFDSVVKFPVINAARGIRYPFEKLASVISTAYNQRQLENLVYEKGFSKNDLKHYMKGEGNPAVDVEKDVKAIESNFKNNQKTIENYRASQNNEVSNEKVENIDNEKQVEQTNPQKQKIEVPEAADTILNDEIVPEIKENVPTKTKNMGIDAV